MEELVDILVATYNTKERYLRKQIESIRRQTHKNIKIYISDDKSTDPRVEEILREYEEKDERIKIYIQPLNLGYNKNFEFLLKKSKAKYIMFSDHDDGWHQDKVEKSLKKLQESYFKYKNVPLIKGKSTLAISRCIGIGCSQIITKEVRNKMIPFKKYVIAHDWLAAFIANEGKGMSYIEEPLFDYRLHNNNVFGGRSLSQNINRWKEKNGEGYESFLKYRKDAITKAYSDGIKMCKKYIKEENEFIEEAEKYYQKILETKKINWDIKEYFKILAGKNIGKKMIIEIVLFHFPNIAYIKFNKIKGTKKNRHQMTQDQKRTGTEFTKFRR